MVEPSATDAGYASVSSRLLALAVDAVLLTGILYVATLALSAVRGPVVRFQLAPTADGSMVAVDNGRAIEVAIMGAVLSAIYFVGPWMTSSATAGQRLFGIRVRRAEGGPLLIGQAAARWLLLVGPLSLGALVALALPAWRVAIDLATLGWYLLIAVTTLLSPTRRGLHDRLAGSVVKSATGAHRRVAA